MIQENTHTELDEASKTTKINYLTLSLGLIKESERKFAVREESEGIGGIDLVYKLSHFYGILAAKKWLQSWTT